jgi:hypothetical protein
MPKMDSDEPKRLKLLNDIELPMETKSSTDMPEPRRAKLRIERDAPN